MTQRRASPSEHVETCPSCGSETPHEVGIELRTESERSENRAFSREPYRVAERTRCGETRVRRMNDA
ncbi:hypothetical protein [Halospeciosus flavus]|uniref:DUF7835 domain-containing protein n=1 Tax=Halospeciosus flavus TaxID=3032283 RepID=A0ABD5Z5Z0_9EURY|nr:hypothetical protein [Halospeciosus flavus]